MCQTLKIKNLSVSLLPITVHRISLRLRSESRDSRSRLSCHRDRQSDALSISLASEKGRKKESCLRERRREDGSGRPRQFIHIHSKGEGRKRHFLHSNYGQQVRARGVHLHAICFIRDRDRSQRTRNETSPNSKK